MSLAARTLEASGLPTLCLGSARDILAAGAPPRSVFIDYPLGHSAGKPFDPTDQYRVVRAALEAFATITVPGTIVDLAGRWDGDASWKTAVLRSSVGDTRMPRDTTPQYQTDEDRRLAESADRPQG